MPVPCRQHTNECSRFFQRYLFCCSTCFPFFMDLECTVPFDFWSIILKATLLFETESYQSVKKGLYRTSMRESKLKLTKCVPRSNFKQRRVFHTRSSDARYRTNLSYCDCQKDKLRDPMHSLSFVKEQLEPVKRF